MGKVVRKRDTRKRSQKDEALPLGRRNFMIIGIGLLAILAGYIAMLEGSVEGFLPLVLAPVLLVIGYCVIIPLGILYKKGSGESDGSTPAKEGGHSPA